jgi:hypothetical protein
MLVPFLPIYAILCTFLPVPFLPVPFLTGTFFTGTFLTCTFFYRYLFYRYLSYLYLFLLVPYLPYLFLPRFSVYSHMPRSICYAICYLGACSTVYYQIKEFFRGYE